MQQPAETLKNNTNLSEVRSLSSEDRLHCPKCESIIVKTYYEPQCLQWAIVIACAILAGFSIHFHFILQSTSVWYQARQPIYGKNYPSHLGE